MTFWQLLRVWTWKSPKRRICYRKEFLINESDSELEFESKSEEDHDQNDLTNILNGQHESANNSNNSDNVDNRNNGDNVDNDSNDENNTIEMIMEQSTERLRAR